MSCGCGCNGSAGGCGQLGAATFELTPAQISDLISRNPSLGPMVTNAEINDPQSLQIGLSFTDSVYGNVLISLDANGYIHYIGNSPVDPSIINAPAPNLPPAPPNPCLQDISSFFGCVQNNAMGLLVVVIAGLYIWKKAT